MTLAIIHLQRVSSSNLIRTLAHLLIIVITKLSHHTHSDSCLRKRNNAPYLFSPSRTRNKVRSTLPIICIPNFDRSSIPLIRPSRLIKTPQHPGHDAHRGKHTTTQAVSCPRIYSQFSISARRMTGGTYILSRISLGRGDEIDTCTIFEDAGPHKRVGTSARTRIKQYRRRYTLYIGVSRSRFILANR